jgi:hypothetical protein
MADNQTFTLPAQTDEQRHLESIAKEKKVEKERLERIARNRLESARLFGSQEPELAQTAVRTIDQPLHRVPQDQLMAAMEHQAEGGRKRTTDIQKETQIRTQQGLVGRTVFGTLEKYQRNIIEPGAAFLTEQIQSTFLFPGEQEIERKARENREKGMGPLAAVTDAYVTSDLPYSVKGFIELLADPTWLVPVIGAPKALAKPFTIALRGIGRAAIGDGVEAAVARGFMRDTLTIALDNARSLVPDSSLVPAGAGTNLRTVAEANKMIADLKIAKAMVEKAGGNVGTLNRDIAAAEYFRDGMTAATNRAARDAKISQAADTGVSKAADTGVAPAAVPAPKPIEMRTNLLATFNRYTKGYNIGKVSYQLSFASDVDKVLFILAKSAPKGEVRTQARDWLRLVGGGEKKVLTKRASAMGNVVDDLIKKQPGGGAIEIPSTTGVASETMRAPTVAQAAAPPLPSDLAGAKPRYSIGRIPYMPAFESDVDRALYIVSQTTKSKADERYMEYLRKAIGGTDQEIRAQGIQVRSVIGKIAKAQPEGGAIRIPATAAVPAPKLPGVAAAVPEPGTIPTTETGKIPTPEVEPQPPIVPPDTTARFERPWPTPQIPSPAELTQRRSEFWLPPSELPSGKKPGGIDNIIPDPGPRGSIGAALDEAPPPEPFGRPSASLKRISGIEPWIEQKFYSDFAPFVHLQKAVHKGLDLEIAALKERRNTLKTTMGPGEWERAISKPGVARQIQGDITALENLRRTTSVADFTQLVPGAIPWGEDIVRRFYDPLVKSVGRYRRELEEYLALKNMEDVSRKIPNVILAGGIVGLDGVKLALAALEARLGPEAWTKVEAAGKGLHALNEKHVLDLLVNEEMIDDVTKAALMAEHPHYAPSHRLDYTERINNRLQGGVGKANVAEVPLLKLSETGSERVLKSPLTELLNNVIKVRMVVAKNRAARGLAEAVIEFQRLNPKEDLAKYVEAGGGENTIQKGTVSYYRKQGAWKSGTGSEKVQKFTVEMDADLANIAKGLGVETDNIILHIMRLLAAPLRFGATVGYPLFLPVNIARDATTALFRENLVPLSRPYFKAMWSVLTKDETYAAAAEAGAFPAGLADTALHRGGSLRKDRHGAISVRTAAEAIGLPFKLLEALNLIGERGTRLAVFTKLQNEGVDSIVAAVRARDATVDFAKSGTYMRAINQIVPFSNAATQGSANMARTIRDHPARSAAYTAVFAAPTIAARVNNMQYETSGLIPVEEYVRNWIVQIAEGTRKDGSKYPIFIRIPKGEIAGFFTFPFEMIFNFNDKENDKSAARLFLEGGLAAIANLSPVELPLIGQGGAASLTSAIPIVGAIAGVATNTDLYTGSFIVPRRLQNLPPEQQFDSSTSALAVEFGQKIGVSPMLIQAGFEDYTAGLGQFSNWMIGAGMEALGFDPEIHGEALLEGRQAPTGVEAFADTPFGRFVNTRDTRLIREGWGDFNAVKEDTQLEFSTIPEVRRLGVVLGDAPSSINLIPGSGVGIVELTPKQRAIYQAALGAEITPRIREFVSTLPSDMEAEDKAAAINEEQKALRKEVAIQMIQRLDFPDDPATQTLVADNRTLQEYWDIPMNEKAARERKRKEHNGEIDVLLVRYGLAIRGETAAGRAEVKRLKGERLTDKPVTQTPRSSGGQFQGGSAKDASIARWLSEMSGARN